MTSSDKSLAISGDTLVADWTDMVDGLSQRFGVKCRTAGKSAQMELHSSFAGGPADRAQLMAVLEPLLECVCERGVEPALQRRAAKKTPQAHVAITVDCINDWFFVRVADDGGQVRNESIYATGSALSEQITKLLATGGHFTIEKSSSRGMAYTFSWERRDSALVAMPEYTPGAETTHSAA